MPQIADSTKLPAMIQFVETRSRNLSKPDQPDSRANAIVSLPEPQPAI